MGMSGQRHATATLYPRGKTPGYPLYRRLGGPQSRSGHRSPGRPARSQTLYCLSYPSSYHSVVEQLKVWTVYQAMKSKAYKWHENKSTFAAQCVWRPELYFLSFKKTLYLKSEGRDDRNTQIWRSWPCYTGIRLDALKNTIPAWFPYRHSQLTYFMSILYV
jgi:hypothetical protein